MYNPRIFKAAAAAIVGWVVPVLMTALAIGTYYRHPIFGTLCFVVSACWVFMLAYYAGHEWVDTFWEDE